MFQDISTRQRIKVSKVFVYSCQINAFSGKISCIFRSVAVNSIRTGTIIPGKNSICFGGAKMAEIDV